MEITTIRAFLERRREIEALGSEEERECLKGLDALATLVPTFLETIGPRVAQREHGKHTV